MKRFLHASPGYRFGVGSPNLPNLPRWHGVLPKRFPTGVDVTSPWYGNQIALSIPTRWFTFVSSGYYGADLRFFFAGVTLSCYNQAGGLTALADGFSVDRSSTVIFATNSARNAVTAPQRPVCGYGGFFQLGFPISRCFNADPKGRNAGWQIYFEYGLDAGVANDFKLAKGISLTVGGGRSRTRSRGSRCSTS